MTPICTLRFDQIDSVAVELLSSCRSLAGVLLPAAQEHKQLPLAFRTAIKAHISIYHTL